MLTKMYVKATTLLSEDEGVTAVEYGIIVAVIAIAVALAAPRLAAAISNAFGTAAGSMGG